MERERRDCRGEDYTHTSFPSPPDFRYSDGGGGRLSIFGRPRREPPYLAFVVKKRRRGKGRTLANVSFFAHFSQLLASCGRIWSVFPRFFFASVLSGEGHLGENQNLQGSGADDISLSPSKCKGFFYFSEYVMREI